MNRFTSIRTAMNILKAAAAVCALSVMFTSPVLADGHGDHRKQHMQGDGAARERMMNMERERRRQAGRKQGEDDPFAGLLFPPDLIMRHRESLNLSDKQGKKLVSLMSDFQGSVVETQWQLAEAKTAVKQLLDADRINEKQVRTALDNLLELENTVKRRHVLLLVQLRNQLTAEQIEKLRSVR